MALRRWWGVPFLILALVGGCDDSRAQSDGGGTDGGGSDAGSDAGGPIGCQTAPIPALTSTSISDTGFSAPVFVAQAPGRPDALWVVEQPGRIQLVIDGSVTTFLDMTDRVDFAGERGLLGLAFHPSYADNGRFFVYYTPSDRHSNVVAEYRRSAGDPNVADDAEVVRLVVNDDPEDNHNGGMIAFGPDGYLYAGVGDGGGGGDRHGPIGNGQNLDTFMGKILRLDVDAAASGYAAPGNPFEGGGGLPQIWAYGVRNPWRFSFDRATHDFWLGDVGQGDYEEIDFLPSGAPVGANFGWRAYEGDAVYDSDLAPTITNHTPPVFVVDRNGDPFLRSACSISGGYVYRGSAIPDLAGTYLFGDYCSPDVGAFRYCEGEVRDATTIDGLEGAGSGLVSFGEDLAGNLYIVYIGSGEVRRIEAP